MTTHEAASTPDVFHAQAYERDLLREALVNRGFTDDGDVLVGDVYWTSTTAGAVSTSVSIEVGDAFPYGPPVIKLVARYHRPTDPAPTFHLDPDGALCLYDDQVEVHDAGWRHADTLLDQIAGWLEKTDAGWPGDTDTDLERYLPQDGTLLQYDTDELSGKAGALKLDGDRVRWLPSAREAAAGRGGRRAGRRQRRVQAQGAYLLNAGELDAPVLSWPHVLTAAGDRRRELDMLVRLGHVRLVVIQYTRGGHAGVLALSITRSASVAGGVSLAAREAADVSDASRRLRAGRPAASLSRYRVAVIGCGAIGSYVADLLLRSGVRRLTLVDHQILRPGNVVRHIAPDRMSGWPKVNAVRATLAATGLTVEGVSVRTSRVRTLRQASELALEHDLVIDATGDQRAAAMLQAASQDAGGALVKVCLQREGGIARVDRWPLHDGEVHASEVPPLPGPTGVRERGCGDLVSLTPPHAVVTAAGLAVRTACAVLTGAFSQASVVDVLTPQPDRPYDHPGPVKPAGVTTGSAQAAPHCPVKVELSPPVVRLDPHDPAEPVRGGPAGRTPALAETENAGHIS